MMGSNKAYNDNDVNDNDGVSHKNNMSNFFISTIQVHIDKSCRRHCNSFPNISTIFRRTKTENKFDLIIISGVYSRKYSGLTSVNILYFRYSKPLS